MTNTAIGPEHLRASVLMELLGIDRVHADAIVAMDNADRNILRLSECGASLRIGDRDPFFCRLPDGHRVEHDWAWMLRK